MPKTLLSALTLLCAPGLIHAQAQHLPRGTATDVTNDDVQATVKKTAP